MRVLTSISQQLLFARTWLLALPLRRCSPALLRALSRPPILDFIRSDGLGGAPQGLRQLWRVRFRLSPIALSGWNVKCSWLSTLDICLLVL